MEQVAIRAILRIFLLERSFFSSLSLEPESPKRIPFPCTVSAYLYEGLRPLSYFSSVMMILPIIITFSFYGGFPLSSVMLSLPWDKPLDSWHWVDRWYHSSCKVISFHHYEDLGCNLPSRVLLLIFKRSLTWANDLHLQLVKSYPDI